MKPIRWLTRGAALASLGVAGGALVVTARHLLSTPRPLESALPGKGHIDRRREGDIYYNVAGPERGDPVVLLHDFYPGASNYEFRRLYPRLATDYRVYAPDWLGFGLSERPALAYTGEFYARLLSGFLRDSMGSPTGGIGRAAIVIADGLAANAAVRAASDDPDLFARLVLVAPHALADAVPGLTLGQAIARGAQRSSLGLMPYAVMATRTALRWRLGRRAARRGEGAATDDALDHASASAHQFGGHHAPLALFTGELDLPILNAFALLEPPVLVVGGAEDRHHTPQELTDLTRLNPYARLEIIAGAGAAVEEDQPAAFVERVGDWLRTPLERHPAEVLMDADEEGDEGGPEPVEAGEMGTPPDLSALAAPPDADPPARGSDDVGAEHAPTSATPTNATPTNAMPTNAMPSAMLADPTLTSANPIERFGEPRGFVTSPPGLDALHGLADEAPDTAPLDEVPAATAAPMPDAPTPDAPAADAPRTIGKPAAAIEETPADDEVRAMLDAPDVPTPVTLTAITAPLDTATPLEDEGAVTTETGPHPVPADARAPSTASASTASASTASASTASAAPADDEPTVVASAPGDEELVLPPGQDSIDSLTPAPRQGATPPSQDVTAMAAASADTAAALGALARRAPSAESAGTPAETTDRDTDTANAGSVSAAPDTPRPTPPPAAATRAGASASNARASNQALRGERGSASGGRPRPAPAGDSAQTPRDPGASGTTGATGKRSNGTNGRGSSHVASEGDHAPGHKGGGPGSRRPPAPGHGGHGGSGHRHMPRKGKGPQR
jgi:pimeloyl-ACP methyl ester carboxylesterase